MVSVIKGLEDVIKRNLGVNWKKYDHITLKSNHKTVMNTEPREPRKLMISFVADQN